jgi:hypothetical protein
MDVPTREDIRGLCTDQSFQRGVNYHDEGRVRRLDIDGDSVDATVQGSRGYEVSVELDDLRTRCTCPYDYAGDCKHIVAVLLAVRERADGDDSTGGGDTSTDSIDAAKLVEETPAEEVRAFLRDLVAEDSEVRDRFVAFAGGETGKTVHNYRREIDQLFDQAAGRGGFIEYGTRIDFSTYHDLAETHRERGHLDEATAIYRALAESITENLERTDDSGGHYSQLLERAVENYAETVREHTDGHDERRPHIEYLFEQCLDDEYGFVADYYDGALRTVCVTDADLEYWLELLDEQLADIDLTDESLPDRVTAADDGQPGARTGARDTSGGASGSDDGGKTRQRVAETDAGEDGKETAETDAGEDARDDDDGSDRPSVRRDETVLYTSDFTDGPLRVEEFTGGAFDVEHLAVGGLELSQFAGDAFEELRVDEPTTVEEHTVDTAATTESGADDSTETTVPPSVSVSTRTLLSSSFYLLEALDREATLLALYEHSYLENSSTCRAYAELLAERGEYDPALDVLADGIETFRSTQSFERLAAELYRERGRDGDDQRSRDLLAELFLDHGDWEAYEELKGRVSDEEWAQLRAEFVDTLTARRRQAGPSRRDERRLLKLLISEGERERAFELVVECADLDWLKRYRGSVADVDPERYFEVYREQLVPFAANETGRKHYRKIADHLEQLQALCLDERFEEFLSFLKEEHSNRPAFLDELGTAGF